MLFLSKIRSIEGWLSDHEAQWLYQMARQLCGRAEVVEIGSWKGKSTVALACGIQDAGARRKVTAIDPHRGELVNRRKRERSTYWEFIRNLKRAGVYALVRPVVKSSLRASQNWHSPIALLFIDGLHDYRHAKADYLDWEKFVTDHGIIAWHDGFCGLPGVWQAVKEVFLTADLKEIGTIGSILYGVKGKPNPWQKILLRQKINLIKLAQRIHSQQLPEFFEFWLIHRLVRLLLLNRYTLSAYFYEK